MSLFIVVTGLLLATSSLITSTPVPSEHSNTLKARIVPVANRRAVDRQTRAFFSLGDAKREIQKSRKRAQHLNERMERSQMRLGGFVLKRDLWTFSEPYDIASQSPRNGMTKRKSSATESMTNWRDTITYADLSVGTPSQTTTVEFDTGSSDLLVPVSDCKACASPFFDPSKSKTFTDLGSPFNATYGGGQTQASGYLASDTVSLGDLSVENQIFAIINSASDRWDGPESGLMGVAFQNEANTHALPWFFNLANAGKLASNVASFYLSRQAAPGSEVCIGCVDSSKFQGEPEYIPLYPGNASQVFWSIVTQGFTYDNKLTSDEPFLSVIDTGTSNIIVSTKLAKALHSHIPGSRYDADLGAYTFPCDKASSIAPIGLMFTGSSTIFNMNPSQLNQGETETGSNRCLSAIAPSDKFSEFAIVGMPFLSSWYSIFDYGNMRVGFAAAI